MIDGSVGRARCLAHDVEAHVTCPRCGVSTCAEYRTPKDATASLRRSMLLACHPDGEAAAQLCGPCLARPRRRRAVLRAAVGVALLGLVAVAAAVVHL